MVDGKRLIDIVRGCNVFLMVEDVEILEYYYRIRDDIVFFYIELEFKLF